MYIEANEVSYTYMKKTPFEKQALKDVSLHLPSGSYTSVIGHTGSGKSTFIQHINGLLKPTKGEMTVGDWTITSKTKQKSLYELRKNVGMVFQYPEHQLFAETVIGDVAFAPVNFGFTKNEAQQKAAEALSKVGIGKEYYHRSPFELSGGQMRRVAIASVLASDPRILILDEPTAGLDPKGQDEIMRLFYEWYIEKEDRSVVLITHQMEDAAKYAKNVIVMEDGRVVMEGTPTDIFSKADQLKRLGLSVPQSVSLLNGLKEKTNFNDMNVAQFDLDGTIDEILAYLRRDRWGC
ncbi:energy-coupling factor transporter ATPase [Bacillus shivajii]|uniref:energy-coupling factor transporter ATPase n=1 Tax=Bacillus shivajii TaxID=1983719 RepID=UPI001CFB583F|nr:energy-coupling factor transporter ATPase [Bacillus shivajii]UCZ53399.1 energy-coupling factor transporter ATPase [Bacillus shivajii]